MKSLIFGYGITGQSFERYLTKKGKAFEIYDENVKGPNIFNILPDLAQLSSYEMTYLSPGINLQKLYTKEEFNKICDLLKRTPNLTELGIFSAMWNEHCSYKSSRIHLKKLNTKGKKVIQGPGENAGVIDIEDDHAIVFKIESHNHPSFIEPYQGAATGVGVAGREWPESSSVRSSGFRKVSTKGA